jgi:replicative superfamily II helicase
MVKNTNKSDLIVPSDLLDSEKYKEFRKWSSLIITSDLSDGEKYEEFRKWSNCFRQPAQW